MVFVATSKLITGSDSLDVIYELDFPNITIREMDRNNQNVTRIFIGECLYMCIWSVDFFLLPVIAVGAFYALNETLMLLKLVLLKTFSEQVIANIIDDSRSVMSVVAFRTAPTNWLDFLF